MHDAHIHLDEMAKMEGQACLDVVVKKGKVEDVKLKVAENKRFFEQACVGKKFKEIPMLVSRVCGTCSAAHLLASIEGIEQAFDFQASEQTVLLRKLLLFGEMIRDHGMHLYYFCLPDIFGKDSILEFEGPLHKWLHDSMDVRGSGTKLSDWIGGRSIHPITPIVGGFSKIPPMSEVHEIKHELEHAREKAVLLVEQFFRQPIDFERKTNHVALVTEDYSFLKGVIKTSSGESVEESDFARHLDEVVMPYSNATGFTFEGKEYSVGALSRLVLNQQALHKNTREELKRHLKVFPNNDPFTNTLAQAIEIVHCIDYNLELLEGLDLKPEKPGILEPVESRGIGCIEAPRGTLYYSIFFGNDGICSKAEIVIPTAQNLRNIERDVKEYLPSILHRKREDIELGIESLVRAYDPCLSCATHFLKVKWK